MAGCAQAGEAVTLPDGLRLRRAHPQDLDDVMWLEHASFPTDAWSAYEWAILPPREYHDTAMKGIRGPSPKKSIGWKKPESQ